MIQAVTLGDLLRPDSILSTGLLVERENFLLFAAGAQRYWKSRGKRVLIPMVGIGGKTEPGEQAPNAARREALEEAGLQVELLDSPVAWYCSADDPCTVIRLDDPPPRPFLIWRRKLEIGAPAGLGRKATDYVTAVYRAVPLGPAYPASEIPALVNLPRSLLPSAIEGVTLGALRRAGGDVIARVRLPARPVFYASGSALYLARLADPPPTPRTPR